MEKKRKGIKRHEALQPLSRHHTSALFMALRLKRAGTEKSDLTLPEIKQKLKEFWETDGLLHFREEEEILLTAYAQFVDIDNVPEVKEMLLEHVKIRALVATILDDETIDEEVMNKLGEFLDTHIRKEERITFPMIEKALSEDKLRELAPYFHEK